MLFKVPAREFESSLRRLLAEVQSSSRLIVLVELPRFPGSNGYGRAQRRLAREFHARLISKREFAAVLASSTATSDGLHLSKSGHRRLAQSIAPHVVPLLRRASSGP
jgi:acyl-CoA thioesterase-1